MEEQKTPLPERHPEEQALREENARLRASLTALLLQKDDLLLIQCRRIEAAYLRRFGALELKVYESFCNCLRAKRKANLIRASQNRRQEADLEQIEHTLDGELASYREELYRRFQKVNHAMEKPEGPGLTPQGQRELRELYRRAVKALHPDLHPGADEDRARTLQQAMRAYRAGDLESLRSICHGLSGPEPEGADALEGLRAERKRLKSEIRELDRQLEAIKADYPYNVRVFLEDPEREKAKQAELEDKLREIREKQARYETAIAQMLAPEEDD